MPSFHIAPLLRERENAQVSAGLLQNLPSTGYTQRTAQEVAGTVPTPVVTPNGGIGKFYFGGSNNVNNLGQAQSPSLT